MSTDLMHSAIRGAVGAMAMTGLRVVMVDLGIVGETPPRAIFRQRAKGLLRLVPRSRRRSAIQLAHWSYGAAGGAAFGAMPESLRRRPWAGPVYSLALWLGFEAGIAPVLIPCGSGSAGPERPEDVVGAALAAGRRMLAGLPGGRIGIIAPRPLVDGLRLGLDGQGPGASDAGTEVDLEQPLVAMDVVTAKGLEFDGVVVVDPAAVVAEQPRGWAALYVAVTRTTQALCFIGGQDLPVLTALERASDASALHYEPDVDEVGWAKS